MARGSLTLAPCQLFQAMIQLFGCVCLFAGEDAS